MSGKCVETMQVRTTTQESSPWEREREGVSAAERAPKLGRRMSKGVSAAERAPNMKRRMSKGASAAERAPNMRRRMLKGARISMGVPDHAFPLEEVVLGDRALTWWANIGSATAPEPGVAVAWFREGELAQAEATG